MNITPFDFDSHTVRVITDDNGNPLFVAKDVAATLGYTNTRKAVSDHCKYAKSLIDLGVTPRYPNTNQGLDLQTKVIPESDVYRLVMRSQLESAERFQDWVVEDVLPTIRKTGSYSTAYSRLDDFELLKRITDDLRLSPSGKLGCYTKLAEHIAPNIVPALPQYAVDAPEGQASSEVTASLKTLLAEHGVGISPIKMNQRLEALGFIETRERPSTTGKIKRFKTITKKGLQFGKNLINPSNPKETQPHWYVSTFADLLNHLETVQ